METNHFRQTTKYDNNGKGLYFRFVWSLDPTQPYTVRSRYIAVIFHCITHERHSIARPQGRGMGVVSECRSDQNFIIANVVQYALSNHI